MAYHELRKGRFSQAGQWYFVTITLARRETAVFRDFHSARLVVHQMRRLHDRYFLESLAWVIMPDHLHWLFQLGEKATLSQVMQQLKGASARAVNDYRQCKGSLWQTGFYDYALRKEDDAQGIARYIIANPLRAGLVGSVREYPHWDARWF